MTINDLFLFANDMLIGLRGDVGTALMAVLACYLIIIGVKFVIRALNTSDDSRPDDVHHEDEEGGW